MKREATWVLWLSVVGSVLVNPVLGQPALSEPEDFSDTFGGPAAVHPGGGCFWLASGSIEPGDVDWIQVTLSSAGVQVVIDVDFPDGSGASRLFASVDDGTDLIVPADGNSPEDDFCGLGTVSDPLGSTEDSAAVLGGKPAGTVVNIGVTSATDLSFAGNHSDNFDYDVWVYSAGCMADSDCEDDVPCTLDSCDPVAQVCVHAPSAALCDDALFCTGAETCDPLDGCQAGAPPTCDDQVVCTVDSCDEPNDVCTHEPDDAACDDGRFCTGTETCDVVADCLAGMAPCLASEVCNETAQTCAAAGGTLLDIKPGSCPNAVNAWSRGVLSVAIVGDGTSDLADVDVESIRLSRTDGVGGEISVARRHNGRTRSSMEDVATPFGSTDCDCHDLGGDGLEDLVLKFSVPEMRKVLALDSSVSGASLMLTVHAMVFDGTLLKASDCIIVHHRGK